MKIKSKWKLLVFALLLVIGIGYAALSANLKIAGTSGVKSNKWIIYFDRIQNESGVVSTETKITDDKQEVDFNITLNEPGDYYEFDVDTVNDGTIDAMIDSVEFGELDDSVKDLVTFDVTYKDGTEIKKCDTLPKESRKTINVKVNYKDDLTQDDLLDEDKSLNLTFTINYVQKSVCENYPSIIVDPNGGTYNGSNKLTEIKADKNSDNLLDAPEREGYEFLYFNTIDGTPLEKDANGKTNVHVESSDVKVIAEWQEDNTPRYTVTIDPNGGFYNASSSNTEVNLEEGETLTLEDPIKENYIFDGWEETTETNSLNENTVTMPAANVTVKAIWKTEADYVARINTKYYTTIQKAFDAAVTDDKVWLLKSTTENATNEKNITFDLGGFTVTGTITNSGTLTIDNGRISNTERSPFVNTGTVNVGTHDGNMIADSIVIFGGESVNGLTQNGTFNFYDGYIEGKIAVTDVYNEIETGYYYIVDSLGNDTKHWQKAYLSDTIDAIVKKVINNRDIYYKLLQDAVDASTNSNPNIYAISNFQDSHETSIGENKIIVLDIAGYNVEEGAAITNNGTFTIKDSAQTKGLMTTHETIVNNGTLNIANVSLTEADTTTNLIDNSGDLNIEKSTLTAQNAYALHIKTGGDLVFDSDTTITSKQYGIYNEAEEEVTITGGNVYGIYNNGTKLTVTNTNAYDYPASASINNNTGTLNLNNINVTATKEGSISLRGDEVTITGGTYNSTRDNLMSVSATTTSISNANITTSYNTDYTGYPMITLSSPESTITNCEISADNTETVKVSYGAVTIDSTNISSKKHIALYISKSSNTTINNSNISSEKKDAISNGRSGNLIINSGTISSKDYDSLYNYGTLTVNGGTITSNAKAGMYLSGGTETIVGGTIQGKTYGIYNRGNITLGSDDNNVSTETPKITGELYGVYNSDGTFNFYDGVLYGGTSSHTGTINKMPDKYTTVKETTTIDDITYEKEYLIEVKKFVQVGSNKYNSLQDAIDAIDTEGTMTLIDTVTIVEAATIPSTKTITFDLNGLKLTNAETITNNGTLTLKDSSNPNTGEINTFGVNKYLITNNKNLTIESGNYNSNNRIVNVGNSSNTTITNGTFNTTSYVVYANISDSNNSAKLTIDNGTFTGKIYVYYNMTSTINGGVFNLASDTDSSKVADLYQTTINGGTFTADKGIAVQISNGIINNATVTSNSNFAIISSATTIKDITATSDSGHAANIKSSSRIEGGTFTSTNARGANVSSSTIVGGIFKGKTYGIYADVGTVIGNINDSVNTSTPVFIGDTIGLYYSYNDISFYDGIMKGKDKAYDNVPNYLPDEYILTDDTEEIDGETYKTSYLIKQSEVFQVGSNTYSSFQKALDSISDTGTITLIGNGQLNTLVTIPNTKNITFDLNGYSLRQTATLTNEGSFTLEDLSADTPGTIYYLTKNSTGVLINKGTLEINDINYESSVLLKNALIMQDTSTASITMNNASIELKSSGYGINASYGQVNIKDGNINTTNSNALYITTNGNVKIEGGSFTATSAEALYAKNYSSKTPITIIGGTFTGKSGIYIYNCNLTMTDGTATGTYESGLIITNNSTANVTGGKFTSNTKYGIEVNGTLTLGENDGTISVSSPIVEGKTYGIYNSSSNAVVNFYDGILKGQTAAYYKAIDNLATNAIIYDDTEIDENEVTKQIAYLILKTNIINNKRTSEKYKELQEAITAASENDTLELINNAVIYEETTIPNKKITLDLAGYDMTVNKKITNNGDLTITDSSSSDTGSIIHTQYINIIENNNILKLDDMTLEKTATNQFSILNNKDLYVNNSRFNGASRFIESYDDTNLTITSTNMNVKVLPISNKGGDFTISNSTITSEDSILYSYQGSMTINGGNYTQGSISNNDSILSIDGGYYNKVPISNSVSDTSINNTIKNITQISDTNYTSISNTNGNLEVKSSTLAGKINNTNGNLTIDTITHTASILYDNKLINNTGILTLKDTSTTLTGTGYGIYNEGTLTLNNYSLTDTGNGNYNTYGIYNKGTANCNKANISIKSTSTDYAKVYGIYQKTGNTTIKEGSFKAEGKTSYGVYQENGTVTVGTYFGGEIESSEVSTTTPLITAIGTTSGIGYYKAEGSFNYYDGKMVGSTNAKPQAPTAIEPRYRVIYDNDENNYEYCILEFVPTS